MENDFMLTEHFKMQSYKQSFAFIFVQKLVIIVQNCYSSWILFDTILILTYLDQSSFEFLLPMFCKQCASKIFVYRYKMEIQKHMCAYNVHSVLRTFQLVLSSIIWFVYQILYWNPAIISFRILQTSKHNKFLSKQSF